MLTQQLVWNLGGITYKEQAVSFLKRFEDSLCVFSGAVEQIYANYNIWPVNPENSKLLVLPNPNAHHDVFQSIDTDAVVKTGLFIIPGEAIHQKGLFLAHKGRNNNKLKVFPLGKGLKIAASHLDEPFMPVITNKDLRELQQKSPILHLHRLKADQLSSQSRFDVDNIQNTIEEKMHRYLLH